MKTHAQKADDLAAKITEKADDALSRLSLEMVMMNWPAEFRAIMWGAVAAIATSRANEAQRDHVLQQSAQPEKS